jgi:hypothetical protein
MPFFLPQSVHHGMEVEVLAAGELGVQGGFLEDNSDAPTHGVLVLEDLETGYFPTARSGLEEGGKHVDRGRLPRSIGPEEPEELSTGNRKRDVVDGREVVEPLGQVFNANGIHRLFFPGISFD